MKSLKLFLGFSFVALLFTSCYTEVIVEEDVLVPISTRELLYTHELWYVNINDTKGNGEVPFLQRAFTVSFRGNGVYANNNMVGFGKSGNGFGIDIGRFDTFSNTIEVIHDVEGVWELEVFEHGVDGIELYHRNTNTSYYLTGYQRSEFDYDKLYFENIHYLLQEYDVWEKSFTSVAGALNEFDKENYLQFFEDKEGVFRSSVDKVRTSLPNIQWDYEGVYTVFDIPSEKYLKTLTLDYDYLDNEYFELDVINDSTIELFHPNSGTIYEFKGKGFIQFSKEKKNSKLGRKRKKMLNPVMNVKSKRLSM